MIVGVFPRVIRKYMNTCKYCQKQDDATMFHTRFMCLACYRQKQHQKYLAKRCVNNQPLFKVCRICQTKKSHDSFYIYGGNTCKECAAKQSKIYRLHHQEQIKNRAKEYRRRTYNPLKRYIKRIKQSYGVSLEWYQEQLKKQNNACAICGKISQSKLYIDHNHQTNQVRELLCNHCNALIGYALEDTKILTGAIDYLKKHNQIT